MRARCAAFAILAGAASVDAAAGIVSLNHWDARVNFGVLADGGSQAAPIQGPAEIVPGTHSVSWDREDGVAMARAGTDYTLELTSTPIAMSFSLFMHTDAFARVGASPEYPAARGVAEAWFDYAIFDFTLTQPALLTVLGASLGEYPPGVHILPPGQHVLEMLGPTGVSWVSVGQSNAAQCGSDFAASFSIGPVPAPAGGIALLGGLGAIGVRRRR